MVESPLGIHVTFTQRHEGVPVYGAEVKVHFSRDGHVIAVNNLSVPHLALDTQPQISPQRALDVALASLPAARRADSDVVDPPELVIDADAEPPALAYRIEVPTAGPTFQLFVDARTGARLAAPIDLATSTAPAKYSRTMPWSPPRTTTWSITKMRPRRSRAVPTPSSRCRG